MRLLKRRQAKVANNNVSATLTWSGSGAAQEIVKSKGTIVDFSSENEALREKIRKFATEKLEPIAPVVDESDEVSMEIAGLMANEGIFRLLIPKEYDGDGLSAVNLCIVREELAKVCLQADYIFAMQALGSYPIIAFGRDEQKQTYLPSLARGEKLASFATTEPGAGSDIGGISTTAVLEDNKYILNGTKCFATCAAVAEPCVVFARTDTTQKRTRGISAFIIKTKIPSHNLKVENMSLFGPHACAQLTFRDYIVPQENLLGEPGQGMSIALNTLNVCRVGVAASALGMAQAAFDEAWEYSSQRIAFEQPLSDFQVIQYKLADMATKLEACRLLTYRAAFLRDETGTIPIKEASMAKYFATEVGYSIVDEALQIHGSIGVLRASHIGRLFRTIRELRVYEGTTEIQNITIYRQLRKERGYRR